MVRFLSSGRLLQLSRSISRSTIPSKLVRSRITIPCLVFVTFFTLSLGIGGPAYLSDEVGYLSKAAAIAGNPVYFVSSWFGGYSFMISPAFFLSSDPAVTWNILLVLNASMWAAVAALLQYMLTRLRPDASRRAVFFATLGAMLYPSWLSMSGYAFATSGFVLILMACLASILKSELTNLRWLGVAAAFAGYLFWIHPLGFVFVGLFAIAMVLAAIAQKSYYMALIPSISVLFAASYVAIVQPWLNRIMSGGIGDSSHYAAGVSNLLQGISTPKYWLHVGVLLAGMIFFLLIATYGLVVYSSVDIIKKLRRNPQNLTKLLVKPEYLVVLLPLLATLGVICFTALSSAATSQLRPDQWIYGRYSDMYVLPLIALGLLVGWRTKQAIQIVAFVLLAGFVLSIVTNPQNTDYAYINKVNLQSFWPIHLPLSLRTNSYWIWGVFGAAAIMICGVLGSKTRRKYMLLPLLPLLMLCAVDNHMYQFRIAHSYASPSTLYQYVRANYAASDCIGFSPSNDDHERFSLYSYYLHGYNLKRMPFERWQQEKCAGPYLTYDPSLAASPALQVKGVESKTGLYMITRLGGELPPEPLKDETPIYAGNRLVGYAKTFY